MAAPEIVVADSVRTRDIKMNTTKTLRINKCELGKVM